MVSFDDWNIVYFFMVSFVASVFLKKTTIYAYTKITKISPVIFWKLYHFAFHI